jgi:hypothetical protein
MSSPTITLSKQSKHSYLYYAQIRYLSPELYTEYLYLGNGVVDKGHRRYQRNVRKRQIVVSDILLPYLLAHKMPKNTLIVRPNKKYFPNDEAHMKVIKHYLKTPNSRYCLVKRYDIFSNIVKGRAELITLAYKWKKMNEIAEKRQLPPMT